MRQTSLMLRNMRVRDGRAEAKATSGFKRPLSVRFAEDRPPLLLNGKDWHKPAATLGLRSLPPSDKKEIEQQRAYYFNYEAEEAKCYGAFDQLLRDEVTAYWTENMTRQMEGRPEYQDRWLAIKEQLAERNIAMPDHPGWDSSFRGMMHAVLSALEGGVGWQFDTLIQCAHQAAETHPESLLPFAFAVEVAGHKELLKSQDSTGKWASRCEVMRTLLRNGDPKYAPPQEWMPALSFSFLKSVHAWPISCGAAVSQRVSSTSS
ncbi:hypothetical protein [Bradyrhizobium sp. 33ap4]|uniref:hypothetical protein n=1 Tax=Bradyrhizobium sp. 33ap4 TaxID=3061630 RepID=UPI00292FD726|nr:hypothetical protein [Bradyrhizobium sp. 33ap4]